MGKRAPDLAPEDLKADDFVNELFRRTRGKSVPQYRIPLEWEIRPQIEQIGYLCKLVSALNHGGQNMQKERDTLNQILFAKEKELAQLKGTLGADRLMIHKQLARINEEKQKLLEENQGLYKEIAALTKKLKDAGIELE